MRVVLASAILNEVQRVLNYPHVQARWSLPAHMITPTRTSIWCCKRRSRSEADVRCTRDMHFQNEVVERICVVNGIAILDDIPLMRQLRRSGST